jgi:hypothetical protein
VGSVWIAIDTFDAFKCRVLLTMWVNSVSVCIEVNGIRHPTDILLEITTMSAYHRDALA